MPAGTVSGYTYSTANRRAAVVWSPKMLAQFLASPRTVIGGTQMEVPGIGSPEERAAIVAYLSRFAPNGALKSGE